jgi:hypothetical protein
MFRESEKHLKKTPKCFFPKLVLRDRKRDNLPLIRQFLQILLRA